MIDTTLQSPSSRRFRRALMTVILAATIIGCSGKQVPERSSAQVFRPPQLDTIRNGQLPYLTRRLAAFNLSQTEEGREALIADLTTADDRSKGVIASNLQYGRSEAERKALNSLIFETQTVVVVGALQGIRLSPMIEDIRPPSLVLPPEVHRRVVSLTHNSDPIIRFEALSALKSYHDKQDWEIVEAMAGDLDLNVRRRLFEGITREYGFKSEKLLLKHVADKDQVIAAMCKDQLGVIHDARKQGMR